MSIRSSSASVSLSLSQQRYNHRSLSPSSSRPISSSSRGPDPNISSMYPGQRGTAGGGNNADLPSSSRGGGGYSTLPPPPSSIDRRLSPQERFVPQHEPVASQRRSYSSNSKIVMTVSPNKEREISPLTGALQFVPAFEEAARAPTATARPPVSAETSWDAIVEEKKDTVEVPLEEYQEQQQQNRKLSASVVDGGNRGIASHNSCLTKPIKKTWQSQPRRIHPESSDSNNNPAGDAFLSLPSSSSSSASPASLRNNNNPLHNTVSNNSATATSKNNSRISRIASMFSSRAVVKGDHKEASSPLSDAAHSCSGGRSSFRGKHQSSSSRYNSATAATAVAPPSPSYSSSSSGYVGWPGTQDKRGATVTIPSSSYEESSCGGGNNGGTTTPRSSVVQHDGPATGGSSNLSVTGGASISTKRELDLQAAAEREMERHWTSPTANTASRTQQESSTATPPTSYSSRHSRSLSREDRLVPTVTPTPGNNRARSASPLLKESLSSMRYNKNKFSPYEQRPLDGESEEPDEQSVSASAALSFRSLFPSGEERVLEASKGGVAVANTITPGWEARSDPSSPSSCSKTSSAYFHFKDVSRQLSYPDLDASRDGSKPLASNDDYMARRNRPEPVVRHRSSSPCLPTAETLAENDRYTPPHRPFPAKGYRGLIEKTKEVPSLMDAMDSESNASSSRGTLSAHSSVVASQVGSLPITRNFRGMPGDVLDNRSFGESDVFDGISLSKESDVFDNLSNFDGRSSLASSPRKMHNVMSSRSRASYPERIAEEGEEDGAPPASDDFQLVVLRGGLATIQTTNTGFSNRKTASDYDENLTNSDVDQYGFARTPGFHEMLSAGTSRDSSLLGIDGNIGKNRRPPPPSSPQESPTEEITSSDSGSSLFSDPYRFDDDHLSIDGDLSEYYIPASQMKKVLRHYRNMSDHIRDGISLEEFEKEEDEHKAFALFEMRSRIMEKDIERGLERMGGTVAVDDIVTTPYFRTANRVRDAIIVSKAWRDGASPRDVINSALLTRRSERTYYIKRPVHPTSNYVSDNASTFSGFSMASQRSYWWEPVEWVDDTDFMLYRCPSLGPRNMRGSEMFTIGDCQSMLLKLTNENCINLRRELNAATKRQIEAEFLLTNDGDVGEGMMTEAEMAYLSAMEEVKEISKNLVCAEQAFNLVKDRIQRLVARYEHFLAKIDTESFAGASSVVTYESSYYSEVESDVWEERERAIWARRAQRAEVKAELAAREALLARQEARMLQEEKQRELEALQQRLLELQSESSYHASEQEHSTMLAKSYAMHRHDAPPPQAPEPETHKQKIDDVKKRFRDRMASRKQSNATTVPTPQQAFSPTGATGKFGQLNQSPSTWKSAPATSSSSPSSMRDLFRSAGEEMYQQLDFYERSLKAVERDELYAP